MITAAHTLLTDEWTGDVRLIETAIARFDARLWPANDCRVVLFEVPRDGHLHVNVTHRHETKAVRGWTGPASVPQGFVNNRTFGAMQPGRIAGHIRDMVFAERV
ncbi:MAG TPA: hypothetical protein VEU08_00930 [Vicinamibacterales bacterium]|nr:hypothetical protein [Vicinamibacterales bacterium]